MNVSQATSDLPVQRGHCWNRFALCCPAVLALSVLRAWIVIGSATEQPTGGVDRAPALFPILSGDSRMIDHPFYPVLRHSAQLLGFAGLAAILALGAVAGPPAPIISANIRFINNNNGTVTESLTGLVWLQNANCTDLIMKWSAAITWAAELAQGACGLTDGSVPGDWRLPRVHELRSLVDYTRYDPALPVGYPFVGVQSRFYWSSTVLAANPSYAWTSTTASLSRSTRPTTTTCGRYEADYKTF